MTIYVINFVYYNGMILVNKNIERKKNRVVIFKLAKHNDFICKDLMYIKDI